MADPTSAAATAAGQSSGGLPQFDPAPWPGEIFWALVVFLVLYLLISRVFVPRVADTIGDREDTIAGDIGQARAARDEAHAAMDAAAAELGQARARAHKVAAEAAAEAHAIAAARQAEEEAVLAKTLAAAEARISDARAEAMSHVHAVAVDAAGAIIARLTGVEASRAEIDGALAQIPSH
jgi:F-type H+-transporting ATPase subunit b